MLMSALFRYSASSWQDWLTRGGKTRKLTIRVLTKLPNTEQSSKEKGKTSTLNQQNQSTTGKLGKPQWPRIRTGISKEIKGFGCHYDSIFNNTVTK